MEVRIGARHGEPKSLVRAAIEHQQRAPHSAQDRYAAYDEVWCVLDVEAPRPHPGLTEALGLAGRHDVHIAISNPCFELWVLLHFGDLTAYQTSDQAQRALEGHPLCGYTPARKHLRYDVLRERHDQASARAVALRDRARPRTALQANPWTDIDLLVAELRAARYGGR